jgi:hypothetical protein
MRSSQALAQSVFGAIGVLNRLPLMSGISAECGRAAFGPKLDESQVILEKEIQTLGEPRRTSVDVWLDGPYRAAIECKLSEVNFGTCSRPRLRPSNPLFAKYCDGNYTRQGGRTERRPLTTIGVRYWEYTPELFGWPSDTDHRKCPLASTYQLVRNVLAACVDETGALDTKRGHALIIYDARNPTMLPDGKGDCQWHSVLSALTKPNLLRRLSWQNFISQWPSDPVLDWLKEELDAKYGLRR